MRRGSTIDRLVATTVQAPRARRAAAGALLYIGMQARNLPRTRVGGQGSLSLGVWLSPLRCMGWVRSIVVWQEPGTHMKKIGFVCKITSLACA